MNANPESAGQAVSLGEAVFLGVVQGATEYLPISSSGHLTLSQHLLGIQEPVIFFDIVLHMGTLAAVIWYYRKSLMEAAGQAAEGSAAIASGGATASGTLKENEGLRLFFLVFIALIPTGVIGLGLKSQFEAMFEQPRLVGVMLIVTGVFLFASRYAGKGGAGLKGMGIATALIVGAAQGLAVAPGISRSGATICAALFMGVERETAARFSFILSIPAVLGALILKLRDNLGDASAISMLAGFVTSAAVGYFCLALLIFIIKKDRFSWFSYYCFAIGALAMYIFR